MPTASPGDASYINLLGEVGWVAMCTRPNIIVYVRLVASYAGKHDDTHYLMLLRISKYLQQTTESYVSDCTLQAHWQRNSILEADARVYKLVRRFTQIMQAHKMLNYWHAHIPQRSASQLHVE